ncbi:FG-GAP-like repeat-containing protein [Propionibacteriaceae bacterium G57]|uniref:FG-GAP-like repeat-containing protein n=1 Tax=Aestuariimicrobium sp. G57 TaxID=3418485 RepID=UPI003DA7A07B
MKFNLRGIAAAAAASALLLTGTGIAQAEEGALVTDAALAACINTAIDPTRAADAAISTADLDKLTALTCSGKGVADLAGLEHATNLTSINASNNVLTDFDELAGLSKLKTVSLDDNYIAALPADMSAMTSLSMLQLQHKTAGAPNKGITSLAPLGDVTTLGLINVGFNQVADLSPLTASKDTLTAIYAASNPLTSFAPVAELTKLGRLWASGPAGTTTALDVAPINGLPELQQLYLNDRALGNADIAKLDNLPKLNQLRIHNNKITDLSVLQPYLARTPFQLWATGQKITLADTALNVAQTHIVKDVDGDLMQFKAPEADAAALKIDSVQVTHLRGGTHKFTWNNGSNDWSTNGKVFSGTFTQTAVKPFQATANGDLSTGCTVNWQAAAVIDQDLADYSNNGFIKVVRPSLFAENDGLLDAHHWVGAYGAGPLHFRIPVATNHAINDAKLVITPGANWDIAEASVANSDWANFVKVNSLTDDEQAAWPAAKAIHAPAPTVEDGKLVFNLGDLPAGTSFQVTFDGIITDGSNPAAGGVYQVDANLSGAFVPGAGAEGCTRPELPPLGKDFAWGDQSGDRIGDIIAVDKRGDLYTWFGTPGGLSGSWAKAGGGWQNFTWISHTPDVNGDGKDDLMGLRKDGAMFLYLGRGLGQFSSPTQVGKNWNGITNITVVGDMNKDGRPEVVGVGKDNGNLYRYTLTAEGLKNASFIGKNWQGINRITSVGDFNNDGTADIIATNAAGQLFAYYSGPGGTIIQAALVGRGWTGFTAMFAPGDMTGDGRVDMVGRNADGVMYLYANLGGGRWGVAKQIATGWQGYTLFG